MTITTPTLAVHPGARGLIFDLDGTLADTMPAHLKAWQETFREQGLTFSEEFFYGSAGQPAEQVVLSYNERFDTRLDPAAISRNHEHRVLDALGKSRRIEPVCAIAHACHGRLPMAIASGGSLRNVMTILKSIGMVHYFDPIITADDPVAPKPDPGIFLHAARRMDVLPACCQVFEDADAGVLAAQRAGMIVTDIRHFCPAPILHLDQQDG